MSTIRLSVCIPTYNFGMFIGETLNSVIRQATEEVEIVIVDGGSTDNTAEVVQQYQTNFPRIHYHRFANKGGIDQDMAKTVELANGEYCWLFSADDIMQENAIPQILREISLGLDVYVCGMTICDLYMRPLYQHPVIDISSDTVFNLSDPKDREDCFRMAKTTTAFFSFMSSLVVKKSRWDPLGSDEAFIGSCWAHVARIFHMIPHGLRVKYLVGSYLLKRGDNDSFLERGLVHRIGIAVHGFHRLAETFFGENSIEAFHIRRTIRAEYPVEFLLHAKLLTHEKQQHKDLRILRQLAAKIYRDPLLSNRIRLGIINLTPIPLLRIARKASQWVRSRRSIRGGLPF